MKKVIPILTLLLSTLTATSVMAGSPYDHSIDRQNHAVYQQKNMPNKYAPAPHKNDRYDDHRNQHNMSRHRDMSRKNIKPARDWRAGQILPRQFDSHAYAVSYKDASRLFKPNKNQQWLKINGDYVLINEHNNKIVRIIA